MAYATRRDIRSITHCSPLANVLGDDFPGVRLSNSYAAESGRVMGLLLCVVVFVDLIWGLTRLPKI